MRAALLATLAVAAVGCAAGKSTVDVTVDSATTLSGVETLRVTVTDAGGKKAMDIGVPVAGGMIPPVQSFALRFGSSVKGRVTVTVEAMPSSGNTPLAGDTRSVDVSPSQRTSLAFTLQQGQHATQLAFAVQPSNCAIAATMKPPVQVALHDSSGMPVTSDGVAVTLALGANPSSATLGGTLTAMTVGGVATFADLKVDAAGKGFTLVASADMLASAMSQPFDVSPPGWVAANAGLYGGNIKSLVVDPKHAATIYAATADAGVWKTIDNGATWTSASAGLPVGTSVSSVAIDPTTTTTLYAMLNGAGIYKTTDGGASWTKLPGTVATADAPYGIVGVDPSNPQNVYAAANRVINRSTNGGAAWSPLTATITYGSGVRSLAFDYRGDVWIATYGDGVQYLAANASTFNLVGSASANPPGGHGGVYYYTAVEVDPTDTNIVWASRDSGGAGTETYRTTDGTTWSALANAPILDGILVFRPGGNFLGYGYGGTNFYTSTDGTNWYAAGMTFAGGLHGLAGPPDGSALYGATQNGVYRLANNSWSLVANGMTADAVTALAIDPKTPTQLFVGVTNAGELRSTDSGATWAPPAAAGAIMLQSGYSVSDIAIDETNDQLVWAAAGQPYRSTDGGTTWAAVTVSSVVQVIAGAPSMSGTFYAGTNGNAYTISAGSSTWSGAGSGLPANDMTAMVVHPTQPMTVYAATTGAGVYRTTNGGAAWSPANGGLTSMNVTALAIDRTTPTTVYAGTSDAGLFKSTDGTTWSAVGSGITTMNVSAVAVSRSQPQIVYVGTRGAGVFRSSDGGATFAADAVGLGSLNVTKLVVDPTNPQLVYVGTVDGGVYKTVIP